MAFDRLPISLLGCYGATWIDTPAFDRLASEAVTFDQCLATTASLTGSESTGWQRAVGLLLKRLAHGETKVDVVGTAKTLSGFAKLAGVTCHAVDAKKESQRDPAEMIFRAAQERVEAEADDAADRLIWLTVPSDFEEGGWLPDLEIAASYLEDFCAPPEARDFVAAVRTCDPGDIAPANVDDLGWMQDHWQFLLQGGVFDAERPSQSRAESAFRRAVAAARVAHFDVRLGKLREVLRAMRGDSGELRLVVFACRGDLLMHHPVVLAGMPSLVEELIHVPVWIGSAATDNGTRRGGLTSLDDLFATLADRHGAPPGVLAGRSWNDRGRCRADIGQEQAQLGSVAGSVARSREFHAVRARGRARDDDSQDLWLFSKPDDVWDLHDVGSQTPEAAERFRALLERPVN